MATRITISKDQRQRLDAAVLSFIRSHGRARASDVCADKKVQRAVSQFPGGKAGYRYVDNSIQRLRRNLEITLIDGNRWKSTTTKVIP